MKVTISIPKLEAAMIQDWLDSNAQVPDAGEWETIKTYTAKFHSGIEADIKVCNTDCGPYIDAVLFEDGCEIGLLEPSFTLLGEYIFDDDGDAYTVNVKIS